MHRLWLQRGETSQPYISRGAVKKTRNSIYFLADMQQTPISQNGLELKPGVIVVSSSTAEHYRRSSAGMRWASMSMTSDDLAAAGRALVGHDLAAPTATQLLRPPPHLMVRLLNLHMAAGRLAATVPDILAHPEVCRAMEQELVQVMIRCLTGGLVGLEKLKHHRAAVMRRFEQLLKDNPNTPMYLPEVCAAIGVAARTLHSCCEEHLGMGLVQIPLVAADEPCPKGTHCG